MYFYENKASSAKIYDICGLKFRVTEVSLHLATFIQAYPKMTNLVKPIAYPN